jgi:hypothetical protein
MANAFSLLLLFLMSVPALIGCAGYRQTVLPRLTMGEEYTDNRDLTQFNPKSDLISTVTPGILYSLTGETKGLTFSYDPSFVYYAQRTADEGNFATRHAAEATAFNQIARHSRLDLRDSFLYTDEPTPLREPVFVRPTEPAPLLDTTIRRSTQPYTTNFTNARFRQDFGRDSFFSFGYTHSLLDNEDPTIANNTTEMPEAELVYWLNEKYGIDLRTMYTRGDYSISRGTPPDSINETLLSAKVMRRFSPHFDVFLQYTQTDYNFDGHTDNYHIYDGSAGIDYHFSETVFATFSAGYFYRTIDNGEPTTGYEVHGDMAKRFSRGSVRLSGGIGYDQAYFGAENLGFGKYKEIALAGTYEFSRRLAGEASGTYRTTEYIDVSNRNETLTSLLAGLTYRFRPWLSTSLRYVRNMADSTIEFDSYNENRISLSITMVPAEPYLLGR